MTEPNPSTETVIVDCDLDEPPHKVWRALTEAELMAAWLGPNDFRPEVGRRFEVQAEPDRGASVSCEVLEVEPDRSITYSWRETREDGPPLDSQVTWTLVPRFDGGTRLRIVHDGFTLLGGRVLALAGGGAISRALRLRAHGVLCQRLRMAA
jgi:uncharacterized protein YndB with AHSA1/START domain